MAQTVTINNTPKIYKHVDACAFPFTNDTGNCLESGSEIRVGDDLNGFTSTLIDVGDCGSAQLNCGPVMGYRAYFDTPLAADICLGDRVVINGKDMGVAIHRMVPGRATGLNDPAARAGETCVAFLGIKSSAGAAAPGTLPVDSFVVFTDATVPTVLPLTDGSLPVLNETKGIEVDITPAAGTTTDVNTILDAFTNKAALPEGYTVKFNNLGDGELTVVNPQTTDALPNIVKNGYACFRCIDGAWRLSG